MKLRTTVASADIGDMSFSFLNSASAFASASFDILAALIFFSISSRSAFSSPSPSSFWIALTCSFK
jgi:hypothetical protein